MTIMTMTSSIHSNINRICGQNLHNPLGACFNVSIPAIPTAPKSSTGKHLSRLKQHATSVLGRVWDELPSLIIIDHHWSCLKCHLYQTGSSESTPRPAQVNGVWFTSKFAQAPRSWGLHKAFGASSVWAPTSAAKKSAAQPFCTTSMLLRASATHAASKWPKSFWTSKYVGSWYHERYYWLHNRCQTPMPKIPASTSQCLAAVLAVGSMLIPSIQQLLPWQGRWWQFHLRTPMTHQGTELAVAGKLPLSESWFQYHCSSFHGLWGETPNRISNFGKEKDYQQAMNDSQNPTKTCRGLCRPVDWVDNGLIVPWLLVSTFNFQFSTPEKQRKTRGHPEVVGSASLPASGSTHRAFSWHKIVALSQRKYM